MERPISAGDVQTLRDTILTRQDLRQELDRFSNETIRIELAQLKSQLLRAMKTELRKTLPADCPDSPTPSPTPSPQSFLRVSACTNTPRTSNVPPIPPDGVKKKTSDPSTPTTRHVSWATDSLNLFFGDENDELTTKESATSTFGDRINRFSLASLRKESRKPAVQLTHEKEQLRKSGEMNQTSSSLRPGGSRFLQKRKQLTLGGFLEGIIIVLIVLNGVFIGVQTDYQATNLTENTPLFFSIVEITFCVAFTTELLVYLLIYRHHFFIMKGWQWNLFDVVLVIMQLIEVVGIIANMNHEGDASGSAFNLSFMRMLRILRLFRILRLVRLLKFIDELAVIISSIGRSFRSLCWTVLLLLMLMYMVGVVLTQIAFTHRVDMDKDTQGMHEFDQYWGSVLRSVFTLYQATMGGIDWAATITPLESEISPLLSVAFCLYIAFVLLAVMNVITGTFVQAAVNDAEKDKIQDFLFAAQQAFMGPMARFSSNFSSRAICPHETSLERFAYLVEGELSDWLVQLDVKQEDAKLLFYLLDRKCRGQVNTDELIDSLVRLRKGAQYMDIMKVMYETERQNAMLEAMMGDIFSKVSEKAVKKPDPDAAAFHASSVLAHWLDEASIARQEITSDSIIHLSDRGDRAGGGMSPMVHGYWELEEV